MILSADVCDLSTVYNSEFHYCVPQDVIDGWLKGTGFGREEPYSESGQAALREDIYVIYEVLIIAQYPACEALVNLGKRKGREYRRFREPDQFTVPQT